jgi:hypothetical protein
VRTFLVILMIVLLPVRGWAVERMGMSMDASGGHRAETTLESQAVGEMPADCPMMSHLQGDASEDSNQTGTTCKSCQLCMGITTPDTVLSSLAPVGQPAGPPDRARPLTSVDLPLVTKPPSFSL